MTPDKYDDDRCKPIVTLSKTTWMHFDGETTPSVSEQLRENEAFPLKENDSFACNTKVLVDGRSGNSKFEVSPSNSFPREVARGPLKKRPTTPVPPRTRPYMMSPLPPPQKAMTSQTGFHVMPTAPLLRQTSSAFSVYSHHQHIHPQACLTTSCGRTLMSQPLLATPNTAMTPGSASHAWSFGYSNAWQPSVDSTNRNQGNQTPGLDLLADQVVRNVGHSHAVVTVPRHHETKQLKKVGTRRSVFEPLTSTNRAFLSGNYPPSNLEYTTYDDESGQTCPYAPDNSTVAPIHTIPYSINKNHLAPVPPSYRPPHNPVLAYPDLFASATSTSKPCKCANSKCLKLYCECFRSGVLCDSNLCRCKDCQNNAENNTRKGPREYAILKIIAKRPDVFHKEIKRRTGNWCKCQKNK